MGLVSNILAFLLGTASVPKPDIYIPVNSPKLDIGDISKSIERYANYTYGKQNWTSPNDVYDRQTFHYVIIGGGTTGLVLAHRLSEDKELKVLVIEAGGDPAKESVVPGLFQLIPKSCADWNFKSEKQSERFGGLNGEQVVYNLGKMLGGTSGMDNLMYIRSNEDDIKKWGKKGIKGLDGKEAIKYYKKAECMNDANILNVKECGKNVHGTDGPILVNSHNVNKDFLRKEDIMLDAFKDIKLKEIKDINCKRKIGVSKLHFTVGKKDKKSPVFRQSTAQSYYLPIRQRKNIYILRNALATKILFNKHKEATGVEVKVKSKKMTLFAANEVILSAGVFNTPKLLMLSGIGPKKVLSKFKIKKLADLPVGKYFNDKVKVSMGITGKLNPLTKIETLLSMTNFNTFPFPVVGGYLDVKKSKKQDISFTSLFFGAFSPLLYHYLSVVSNFNQAVTLSYMKASLDNEILIPQVVLEKPKSMGVVTIRSKNPEDPPKIFPNLLSKKEDIYKLVKGIKKIYKLKDTKYFKKAKGRFVAPLLPQCLKYKVGCDEYWECYVKNMATTGNYAVGTCRIGKDGVVDEKLRVNKVKSLRVIDASVYPSVNRGNKTPNDIMIAEYAAQMIKDENKKKHPA